MTLTAALVGYGTVGKAVHAPLIAATPGLALAWVVSSDEAKVRADFPTIRVTADLAVALADPALDLVVIATPNHLHAPQALLALAAGKHVVVDKPFTVTLAEADLVAAAARKAGRVLSVFQNRRWDGDFLTLRDLLARGELGDIAEFRSHYDRFRPQVLTRWKEAAGAGGGIWYDLAPHLLDQALVLFGPPRAIFADIGAQRPGAPAPDYFHAQLFYPRLRAQLHAGCLVADPGPKLAVYGSLGAFVKYGLDRQEQALKDGIRPGHGDWGRDDGELRFTKLVDGQPRRLRLPCRRGDYGAFYRAMVEAMLGRGPPPVTPAEALTLMRLLQAGLDSAAEGRPVALAQPSR